MDKLLAPFLAFLWQVFQAVLPVGLTAWFVRRDERKTQANTNMQKELQTSLQRIDDIAKSNETRTKVVADNAGGRRDKRLRAFDTND